MSNGKILIEAISISDQIYDAGHGRFEQFCEVTTTVNTEEDGARLQEALTSGGLTTGASLTRQVSVFKQDDAWGKPNGLLQDGIARVKEYRLRTIVRASDCEAVIALLESVHPHQTPLITIAPVVVNAGFAAWYMTQVAGVEASEQSATIH